MSREAPPREAPVDQLTLPAPERPLHSAVWLALPLLGLALFVAYRLATGASLRELTRLDGYGRETLDSWRLTASGAAALMLMGFMAARRKGRELWVAADVVAGALPWVVALAAQSLVGRRAEVDALSRGGVWGGDALIERVVGTLVMHEVRGLGALVSGCLWGSAALAWLLPHFEKPRWRGMGLAVVTLPLWGVAYGFPAEAGALPWLAAAFLSGVVALVGSQSSLAARQAGRSAVVLATLCVLALLTATQCATLPERAVTTREAYIVQHGTLLATLSAARLGAILALLPATLAARWITRRGDPAPSWAATVALVLAFVGMMTLDRVGSRVAQERLAPAPWPVWADVDVQPLPLAAGVPATGDGPQPRFIVSAGALRDPGGVVLSPLDDVRAVARALSGSTTHAELTPDPWTMGAGRRPPRAPEPAAPVGERLAIVALDVAAEPLPVCRGARLSLLLDRSVTMADLRAVVSAALLAGVSELDLVGPLALSAAEKLRLADALRESGQEGALPLGGSDELRFVDATLALPSLGVAALDALRYEVGATSVVTPSACWRAELLGEQEPDADEPVASPQADGPGPGELGGPVGERLNEAPPESYDRPPARAPRALWLDPGRDVASFLLDTSSPDSRATIVMWALDPPAP